MAAGAPLTAQRIRQLVSYDQETGVVTRLTKPCNKTKVGAVVGGLTAKGYLAASLDDKVYLLHRAIWLYMTGSWPDGQVDHINGIRTDNRWSNLRLATAEMNTQNIRAARVGSTTGLLGAYAKRDYFTSQITANKRTYWLGSFQTAQEAHEAYIKAKRQLHEGCTI